MDFSDYRKKLNIDADIYDIQKDFIAKIQIFMYKGTDYKFEDSDEADFCYEAGLGMRAKQPIVASAFWEVKEVGLQRVWFYLNQFTEDFTKFLYTLVVFANSYKGTKKQKEDIFKGIDKAIEDSGLNYVKTNSRNRILYLPKGAKELDDKLVSETLEWLENYPQSKKQFISALEKYSLRKKYSASDIADDFRKSLERFFQEFFKKKKTLENLISDYGKFLKDHNVPKEISNNLLNLLDAYTKFNNAYSKHHDKAENNILEYIMYQTGNIVRLLITLSKED